MRRLRTFVAVELGPRVRTKAQKLIRRLTETGVEANWIPPEQMHLTLKFLGEILETEIVDVCRVVAAAVADADPFEITFRGAGAFPDLANPKTLWVGITEGTEELVDLQQRVEAALHRELRFPRERRQYTPHLTIGRVKRTAEAAEALAEVLTAAADFDGDLTVVDEVTTFASFLSKSGPTYEALAHAPLGKPVVTKKMDDDNDDDDEDFDDEFDEDFDDDSDLDDEDDEDFDQLNVDEPGK